MSLESYYYAVSGVALLMAIISSFQIRRGHRRFVFAGAWLMVSAIGLGLRYSVPFPVLGLLIAAFIGLVFLDSVLRQRGAH